MRDILRFVLRCGVCLSLLWASLSHAQTSCSEFSASYSLTTSAWHKTIPAAASELAATLSQTQDTSTYDFTFVYVSHAGSGASGSVTFLRTRVTRSTGVVQEVNATGSWQHRSAPCACPAGSTFTKTFGVGWASSTTEANPSPSTTPPVSYCDGSCLAGLDELIDCHVQTDPGPNGHYELTCDVRYVKTGQECTEQTPDPDNPEPDSGDPDDGEPPSCADGNPDCDPGDGEPGDGEPGDGEPGDGEPGDGEPGDGEPGDGGGGGSNPGGPACTQEQIDGGLCSCTNSAGQQTQCGTGPGGPGGGEDDGPDEWGSPVPVTSAYDKKQKTFQSVLQNARGAWSSTSLGSGLANFFTVQGAGGTCRVYTASIPYIDATVTIDAFCQSWVLVVAAYIKAALLLVAAFYAFRVAFL